MPLYEYACGRCESSFEEFVSIADKDTATPVCPKCAQQDQVTRVLFAALKVGKKEDLRPPYIKGPKPPRR